ncbi:MAG TPA: hypothetical protein VIL34_01805 [Actinopolymorphaceae bacterium]
MPRDSRRLRILGVVLVIALVLFGNMSVGGDGPSLLFSLLLITFVVYIVRKAGYSARLKELGRASARLKEVGRAAVESSQRDGAESHSAAAPSGSAQIGSSQDSPTTAPPRSTPPPQPTAPPRSTPATTAQATSATTGTPAAVAHSSPATAFESSSPSPTPPPEVLARVTELKRSGRMTEAITVLREATGMELYEASQYVRKL